MTRFYHLHRFPALSRRYWLLSSSTSTSFIQLATTFRMHENTTGTADTDSNANNEPLEQSRPPRLPLREFFALSLEEREKVYGGDPKVQTKGGAGQRTSLNGPSKQQSQQQLEQSFVDPKVTMTSKQQSPKQQSQDLSETKNSHLFLNLEQVEDVVDSVIISAAKDRHGEESENEKHANRQVEKETDESRNDNHIDSHIDSDPPLTDRVGTPTAMVSGMALSSSGFREESESTENEVFEHKSIIEDEFSRLSLDEANTAQKEQADTDTTQKQQMQQKFEQKLAELQSEREKSLEEVRNEIRSADLPPEERAAELKRWENDTEIKNLIEKIWWEDFVPLFLKNSKGGNCELQNVKLVLYPAGDPFVYIGNIVEGRREGIGVLEWFNGDKYEGNFVAHALEGKGKYTWAGGKEWYYYEGEWKAGTFEGYGVAHLRDGNKYEGNYVAGKLEGKGKHTSEGGKEWYEGEYKAGKKHGYGIHYDNGNKYEGNYVAGECEGKGKYTWAGGKEWHEGEYKADKKHGYGVEYFSDGDKYEGNYVADEFEGQGKYSFAESKAGWKGEKWVEGEWDRGKLWVAGRLEDVAGHLYETDSETESAERFRNDDYDGLDDLLVPEEQEQTTIDQARKTTRRARPTTPVFPREVDNTETETVLCEKGVAFEQQSEAKSVLKTFSLADEVPLWETARTTVAALVANRLENKSVKRKNLAETLLKLNLHTTELNLHTSENHEHREQTAADSHLGHHAGVSSKITSKITSNLPSSIPASWGTGLGSGPSGREGGDQSQNVQDLQALIAQVLQLEAVLRAVDSALEKVMEDFPGRKEQITKLRSSYKRPDTPSDAHAMAMAEIQRIDEELRANFGKDLDDLLNQRIGKGNRAGCEIF